MTEDPFEGRQIVEFMVEGSARSLFANACEYREAVLLLMSAYNGRILERMFRPLHDISGICIELLLKSYLLQGGAGRSKVRALSHNLADLLRDATDLGLVLDEQFREQIIIMSETARNGFFRYGLDRADPKPGYLVSIPHLPTVAVAIELLCWKVGATLDIPWPEPAGQPASFTDRSGMGDL